MDKIVFRFNRFIFQFPLAMLCFIILGVFAVPPQAIAQTAEPLVAIHVSELTNALDPTADSWHYYVAYESLEEALRSDGTPFIEISDSDIAAGNLSNPDGSPKYPILISLGAAAIDDNEITPLSNYVNAGGFLFAGSNSFTLNPDGSSRSDFALAGAMGLDAMYRGKVADGHPLPDCHDGRCMDDYPVFNSSFITNYDGPEITSDHSAGPDPAVFTYPHVANNFSALCDPCPFTHQRDLAIEFEDCHKFILLLEINNLFNPHIHLP